MPPRRIPRARRRGTARRGTRRQPAAPRLQRTSGCRGQIDAVVEVLGPQAPDGGRGVGQRGDDLVDGALAEEEPLARASTWRGRRAGSARRDRGTAGCRRRPRSPGRARTRRAAQSSFSELPATVTTVVRGVEARDVVAADAFDEHRAADEPHPLRDRVRPVGSRSRPASGTRSNRPSWRWRAWASRCAARNRSVSRWSGQSSGSGAKFNRSTGGRARGSCSRGSTTACGRSPGRRR